MACQAIARPARHGRRDKKRPQSFGQSQASSPQKLPDRQLCRKEGAETPCVRNRTTHSRQSHSVPRAVEGVTESSKKRWADGARIAPGAFQTVRSKKRPWTAQVIFVSQVSCIHSAVGVGRNSSYSTELGRILNYYELGHSQTLCPLSRQNEPGLYLFFPCLAGHGDFLFRKGRSRAMANPVGVGVGAFWGGSQVRRRRDGGSFVFARTTG